MRNGIKVTVKVEGLNVDGAEQNPVFSSSHTITEMALLTSEYTPKDLIKKVTDQAVERIFNDYQSS